MSVDKFAFYQRLIHIKCEHNLSPITCELYKNKMFKAGLKRYYLNK